MKKRTKYSICLLSLFIVLPLSVNADVIIVSPADFVPNSRPVSGVTIKSNLFFGAFEETTVYNWLAPVDLPHGSKITKVKIYYWDNLSGEGEGINVSMKRRRASTSDSGSENIFSFFTLGASTDVKEEVITTFNYPTVRAKGYHYYVHLELPVLYDAGLYPHLRLYGVKIIYYVPK